MFTEAENGNTPNVRRMVAFTNVLLRYRWLVIGLPVLAGAISLARSLTTPRTYTTRTTFMSQSPASPSRVPSGALAQFGINLGPVGDPTLTPEFYVELLRSRPVLQRTVRDTFDVPAGESTRRATLAQFYGSEEEAISKLQASIGTSIGQKTAVVTLTVRAPSPVLAQQLAAGLIEQLDHFNRARRKSRIGAERAFTEARLAETAMELRQAENVLQDFYTRNRDFDRSPELKFREERLAREVQTRQLMHSSLSQAFEQAKIDEVRDTPVITVIEEPAHPARPDSRNTVSRGLVAMAVALLLGILVAFGMESTKRARLTESDELVEMKSLGRELVMDLRNPVRTARRLFS